MFYAFKKYFKRIRYLIKIITFPLYILCFLQIKSIVGLFNILRANFTDYMVTRKDRYYAGLSFIFIAIYIFFYFGLFEFFYQYGVFGELDIYIEEIINYYNQYKMIVIETILIILTFTIFDEAVFKQIDQVKDTGPGKMKKNRLRKKAIKSNKIFAGTKFTDTKRLLESEKVYITDEMRSLNVDVIGTTGTGKSQSFIFPWAFQDIKRGKGCMIIDAKGDREFYEKLYAYHKKHNTENNQHIKFVNLGNVEFSNTYNPLFRGSAIELKDRIMGAFEWGDGEARYYKSSSENVLMILLQAVESLGKTITFHDLYVLLTNKEALEELRIKLTNQFCIEQLTSLIKDFDEMEKKCSGLINNINLIAHGGVGKIVNTYEPEIDLLNIYKENQIVYFTLPTNLIGETARAFGRMLLMDIKSLTGYIERGEAQKRFYPVFIDEFAEFATKEFVGWLNKTRSSGIAIHLAHQSLGDLEQVDEAFVKQVIDNTNMKMFFRVNDPDTAEKLANYLGTQTTEKETIRVNKSLLSDFEGEMGSIREVEEYQVNPNIFKSGLKRGQAVFNAKHPSNQLYLINTDYLEDIEYDGSIELDMYGKVKAENPFNVDEMLLERKERIKNLKQAELNEGKEKQAATKKTEKKKTVKPAKKKKISFTENKKSDPGQPLPQDPPAEETDNGKPAADKEIKKKEKLVAKDLKDCVTSASKKPENRENKADHGQPFSHSPAEEKTKEKPSEKSKKEVASASETPIVKAKPKKIVQAEEQSEDFIKSKKKQEKDNEVDFSKASNYLKYREKKK